MSDYRFDTRSKETFKKDIKHNHAKEAVIAVRLCIDEYRNSKKWPSLIPSGVDTTGKFIENIRDVTSDPDFKINDRLVEITRADVVCNRYFHQKCTKIDRCLREGHDLVFVNGYGAVEEPNYIRVSGIELAGYVEFAKAKYGQTLHPGGGKLGFTNKPAYRFDISLFEGVWKPLPVIVKSIPNEYKKIIEAAKA